MSITVNNIAPADLAISDLRLHFASLDDDYCDITFPLSYDSAIREAFAEGAPIVIRDGTSVLFSGICPAPVRNASGSSQSVSLRVYGPFHDLRRETFYQLLSDSAGTSYREPVFSLSGSAQGVIQSLLSGSSSDRKGTVANLGNFPSLTFSNTTRAAALQTILRFFPAARSYVTYGVTTQNNNIIPTAKINIQSSGSPVTLSPSTFRIPSLSFSPANPTPDGLLYVALRNDITYSCYLVPPTASDGPFTGSPVLVSNAWNIVSSFFAGNHTSKRAYIGAAHLDGNRSVTNYTVSCTRRMTIPAGTPYTSSQIASAYTSCADYANANEAAAYAAIRFCAQFGSLNGGSARFSSFSGSGQSAAGNMAGAAKYVTVTSSNHTSGCYPIVRTGQSYSPGSYAAGATISQMSYVGLSGFSGDFATQIANALGTRALNMSYKVTGDNLSASPLTMSVSTLEAANYTGTFSVTDDTSVMCTMPDASLLAALQATTPSISASILVDPDLPLPVRPSDYAVILPSVSSTPCPIQTIDIDLLRRTLSLAAGSPRQLSPDDYLSLRNLA